MANKDDWLDKMHQAQAELATMAVNEVNRLRRRVRDLESEIAAMPSTFTDLQDRIVLLEGILAANGIGKDQAS